MPKIYLSADAHYVVAYQYADFAHPARSGGDFSGLLPNKTYFLLPFPLLCLALFCLGLGMLLASAMVFFRDIQFLWGVLTTIWMYLTPIFYPITALPETIQSVVKMNPLYFLCDIPALVRHRRPLTRAIYVRTVRSGCIITLAIGAFTFKNRRITLSSIYKVGK